MSIRRKMAHGVIWMVSFKLLDRSLGLISMLVLARLLLPSDFGLVAMATSLIALLELFAAFGVDTALVQRADATPAHFNSAWTLNALAGFAIGAAMLLLSVPMARFYGEPRAALVICALACGAMTQGLENVGVVMFRKEMQFDREFRFMLAKKVIAFAVGLPLAFLWRNYWALVAGMLIGRVSGVVLSYAMHPFRPRFSFAAAGDLLHVSKWLITQNLITFLRERSSDFIIGRFAGPHALGVFSVSAEISNMPGTELVAPINRAVLPAYVRLAHDLPALGREYLSVMAMIALVAVPAVAGFAACAPFLVLVVLGPKWIDAAVLLQILAFFGITQVLQSNAYSAFLALGKHPVFVKINGVHVTLLLPAMVAGTVAAGIEGAAWAYVATGLAVLPFSLFYVAHFLQIRRSALIGHLWRPLVAAALMYGIVRTFGPAPPQAALAEGPAAAALLTCIAIGVPSYVLAVAALWLAAGRPQGTAESWLIAQIPVVVRKMRGALAARSGKISDS
jgi:lipopolysaccharide exporter